MHSKINVKNNNGIISTGINPVNTQTSYINTNINYNELKKLLDDIEAVVKEHPNAKEINGHITEIHDAIIKNDQSKVLKLLNILKDLAIGTFGSILSSGICSVIDRFLKTC